MKFQPLECRASFWDIFERRRRVLLRQLAERVENNINLDDYWSDKDDLAIVKIIGDAIYQVTKIKAPLLPDDPIELVSIVVEPPLGLEWAEVLMEVEDHRNCSVPEKGLTEMKTVADLVAIIKSAPERVPPTPQEKAKARRWNIGCFTVLGIIVTLLVLYFLMF